HPCPLPDLLSLLGHYAPAWIGSVTCLRLRLVHSPTPFVPRIKRHCALRIYWTSDPTHLARNIRRYIVTIPNDTPARCSSPSRTPHFGVAITISHPSRTRITQPLC